ncbi:MAG: PLP-dependent cysteine synthase family protein [Bacteroidetes bacterium]|nr:PLP-dependent cysteine synthase family protein [Bacteroidota bacterium]MBU2584084.1 PLP-dependent cysteine synthase family protein [Bacteroidota bacterium]
MNNITPATNIQTDKIKNLKNLIGNTPLLAVHLKYKNESRVIYAKSENLNMTGSIKDRMALYILDNACRKGDIKPGDKIAEATSGNTGISFSAIGRALGHQVIIFMPDWMSRERVDLIRSFGAKIIPVSKEQGGFLGSIKMSEEFAKKETNVFLPCQFSNAANVEAHYSTTGPEIFDQLNSISKSPDAFVAGVGTGGTVMGVGKFLREKIPGIKVHPLEPAESPTLSTGHKVGHHRIQGISDEFIPAICRLSDLDEVIEINDGDAVLMAQKLACELGLAVGISSGANLLGALKVQNDLGVNTNVITVFADDNKKYLSTDLLRNEPKKNNYLSTDVELIGFETINRVCNHCLT